MNWELIKDILFVLMILTAVVAAEMTLRGEPLTRKVEVEGHR